MFASHLATYVRGFLPLERRESVLPVQDSGRVKTTERYLQSVRVDDLQAVLDRLSALSRGALGKPTKRIANCLDLVIL